jgi:CotS family spore coat protein
VKNRSAPARDHAGGRKERGPTIWVPAGTVPLVTAGVIVMPMDSVVTLRPPAPAQKAVPHVRETRIVETHPVREAAKPVRERQAEPKKEAQAQPTRERQTEPQQERRAPRSPGRQTERQATGAYRTAQSAPPPRASQVESLLIAHPAPPGGAWNVPALWDLPVGANGLELPDAETSYVPAEVEAAGQLVMSLYEMRVSGMQLITTKPDKGGAIWRIETDKGPRSLKMLHRPASRSLFSVGAQDYLVKQGARVPALVPTRGGELAVEIAGKLWIVTDWVEGLVQATKIDLEGAAQLCYGLGEFHQISRGYVPPKGAHHSSRLYRWPKTYQKVLTKIDWFREIARLYPEMPASPTLLSVTEMFEQQARDAIARLEASAYGALVARGEQAWGLAHQDYGWSNGQVGPGGVWIIDLDGVSFDLAIRDLRKLITSTMDDMGVWDVTWMRGMIDAYNRACPIEAELYQVLLIDMALPNEFYKHVKEGVTKNQRYYVASGRGNILNYEPILQRSVDPTVKEEHDGALPEDHTMSVVRHRGGGGGQLLRVCLRELQDRPHNPLHRGGARDSRKTSGQRPDRCIRARRARNHCPQWWLAVQIQRGDVAPNSLRNAGRSRLLLGQAHRRR